MDTLRQDLRLALRRLARAPGFTAIALLTLAIGIGANTAVFTIVHSTLWRPLAFPEPDRLVRLFRARDAGLSAALAPANFFDARARSRTLSVAAGFFPGGNGGTFTLTGHGDPVVIEATQVTDGFFDVLRIAPLHGRTLRRADNQPGQHHVAVLGYPLWRERFGGDPRIVGKAIRLGGTPYLVVGVMPEGVYSALGKMWVPLEYTRGFVDERDSSWLNAIARLAPGQSIDTARREIETIGQQLEIAFPDVNRHTRLTARPLHAQLVADLRTPLLVLLGAAGFVLLIACANVANLLLARTARRAGEMAVRAALGGSRARLLRQLLTESLVLATGGGLLGLLLAVWTTELLVRLRPVWIQRLDSVQIEPAVLLFTTAITMLTGVIFGCLPAWQAARANITGALLQRGTGAAGRAGVNRLRGALIVAEMALAVLLLTGAGLLMRSFVQLQQVDPGFQADRALAFRLSLPDRAFDTDEKRRAFFGDLLARLRAVPGVEAAAAASFPPMAGRRQGSALTVAGRPEPKPGEQPSAQLRIVTPEYFAAAGIPLRRGRVFTDADAAGAAPVLLLTESAARRYFPNDDPIGRRITLGWRGIQGDVVGVVGDVKEMGLDQPAEPQVYVAAAQVPLRNAMSVLVRTTVPPMSLARTVRQTVHAADPNLAVSDLDALDARLAASVSQSRFTTLLFGTFAAAALLLAAIGIFGVLSNAVALRTREIGIRLALGAQGSQVRRLVLQDAFRLAALGIALGLVASLPLTRLLSTQLFDLAPTDPLTLAGVVTILLGVALLASYLPARRASRVDPVVALRAD